MSGAHALLSASGAARWLACPPSARLEEQEPDSTSTYAQEGTLAHAIAELMLRKALGRVDAEAYEAALSERRKDPLWAPEMEGYLEECVAVVEMCLTSARERCADPVVFLEQPLDYSEWALEGFGTGDIVIIADELLDVIDLKYGQGVPVDAVGNPQLRLYGLGALGAFRHLYDIERIRMTIVQPRLDSISCEELSVEELLAWAEEDVKPRAELAHAGAGELTTGPHCGFCRVHARCPAQAEEALALARHEFALPPLLTLEAVAEILPQAEKVDAWLKQLQAYATAEAQAGRKVPGYKLVEGRSNRVYSDEDKAAEALLAQGYDGEKIYQPRKLKGITDMTKTLTKKTFAELLENPGLVIKPAGKPVLVPETDARPELQSAEQARNDFAE